MSDTSGHPKSQRSKRAWQIILVALLVLVIAGVLVVRNIGRWLVVEDPLTHAGAIVVLSGGLPFRALEAARIYQEGMAPEVWLTRPWHSPAIDALGLDYKSEEYYSQELLVREGVPLAATRILGKEIVNTEEEDQTIFAQMRSSGISRVIIVTSPPHTRRVRTLWKKLAPEGYEAIVRAATLEPYDAQHWWRNTKDTNDVTREVLGLLNAWAGLPLRPMKH